MKAPLKLALYGAGLTLVFGASFLVAGAVVPPQWAEDWQHSIPEHSTPAH